MKKKPQRRKKSTSTIFGIVITTIALAALNVYLFKHHPLPPSSPTAPTAAPKLFQKYGREIRPSKKKLEEALIAIERKDEKRAIKLLNEAIDFDSDNVTALALLSGIYLNQGQKKKARDLAEDCLDVDHKNVDCNTTMISSYTRFGEFDQAQHYLSDCLVDDLNNIFCHGGMVTVYLHRNRLSEAKEAADRIQKLQPDSIWANLAYGQYYEQTKDLKLAIDYYQKACSAGQAFACAEIKTLTAEKEKQ